MIARLGSLICRIFERTAPDPFVLAVLLTLVTAALALTLGDFSGKPEGVSRAVDLLDAWRAGDGLWRFLAFGMQMCLVLVTGHALAASTPVRALLTGLAGVPRSAPQAAAMVGLVACVFGLINWGLGLIVGALLARDVARALAARGVRAHYPLLAAAGYAGMAVWHGGLSGSAPLTMTSAEGAAKVLPASVLADFGTGVPLGETVLSPMNLVATAGLLVIVPVVLWMLTPSEGVRDVSMYSVVSADGVGASSGEGARRASRTVPDLLHDTPPLAWLLGLALLGAVVRYGSVQGLGRVGLNEINAGMLGLGLLLHGSTASYVRAVEDGAKGCAGVILQFPLYAGIMALLVSSGLIASFSAWLSGAAGDAGLPLLSFLSAGVVNLFVPSGGGQWGIQGPIVLEAGAAAGLAPGKMIMAVAYGDQLTNLLQPFWALPLLAITGVKAREIVGYTCVLMIAMAVWLGLVLLVF
jgi:short-chain fatty acids transporter